MAGTAAKTSRLEAPVVRGVLLAVLVTRGALGLLAVALAASLYKDHFVVLVLLRPTKEVLLAAGFAVREHEVALGAVYAAAIPLAAIGVWASYLLGRSYATSLDDGVELPRLARRLLPPSRIKALRSVLEDQGTKVVFLGRLAVFPSTLMAAAAGASKLEPRAFAIADTAGLLVAITEVVAAGYLLGETYERAGPWLTGVGVVITLGLMVLLGRWLRDQHKRRS